jgi:hypothetical protein
MDGIAQPLSFGQLLDRTLRLLRANLKSFIALSVVPAVGLLIALLAIFGTIFAILRPDRGTTPHLSPPEIAVVVIVCVASFILMMAAVAIFQPAVCYTALRGNRGIQTGWRAAYSIAWDKRGRYLWLMVLQGLITVGPMYGVMIVMFGLFWLAKGPSSDLSGAIAVFVPLTILFYLAGMVYAALMMIKLALAIPACVEENLPAIEAVKRSFRLSRGAMGRIFLAGLVIYAMNYAAVMVFEVVAAMLGGLGAVLLSAMQANLAVEIALGAIFGVLVFAGLMLLSGLLWCAISVAYTLVYRDQRLRREGPSLPAGPEPEGPEPNAAA